MPLLKHHPSNTLNVRSIPAIRSLFYKHSCSFESHLFLLLTLPHPETWVSIAYRDIALATPHDTETIEEAFEEGQNLLYSMRHDGPLPAERELTLEALKMFDEAMRRDPLLALPASPNWAVGFLAGFIQSSVEGQPQQTEPLSQVAKEEA